MAAKKKTSAAENGTGGRAKQIGRYIVADPKICHGALTFRGTRIFVSQVLDMVAQEIPWDRIIWEWRGSVPREAIAEAVYLARGALLKGTPEDEVAVERSRKAS